MANNDFCMHKNACSQCAGLPLVLVSIGCRQANAIPASLIETISALPCRQYK